jgi:hypothetical protein
MTVRCSTVVWLDLQRVLHSPSCFFIGNCQPINTDVMLLTFSPDWLISGLSRFKFTDYLRLFTYEINQNLNDLNGNLPLILIKFLQSRCNGYVAMTRFNSRFFQGVAHVKMSFVLSTALWYVAVRVLAAFPSVNAVRYTGYSASKLTSFRYWNEDISISSHLRI